MCKRFSDGKMWQVFFESLEENACLCEGMSGFCICRLGLYIDRLFSPSISYLVGNTCVASVNKEGKISHGRFQEDLDVSPLSPSQELPGPRFHSQALFWGWWGEGGGTLVFWTDLRGPAQEVADREREQRANRQQRQKRNISSAPVVTKLKNSFCCCFLIAKSSSAYSDMDALSP